MYSNPTEIKHATPKTVHQDLETALKLAYEPCGLICNNLVQEQESKDYGACMFELNNMRIKFRVGKITPTKIGQFVTLWKRIGESEIMPHDIDDPFDFYIVSVRNAEHFGQFVFPKSVLLEKGILSKEGKGGKRAMRIYPSWDTTDSKQAKSTQAWQLKHFFEIHSECDPMKVQKLFLHK